MDALSLSTLDISLIVVYFAVVLFIGLWVGRNTKTGDDLFLAGRSLRWPAIGFSLFASNISSTTLIGLVGAAYVGGLYVSNYEWMATVVLVFMVFTFIPIFLRSRVATMPEFLEKRFDRRSRSYFSVLNIVTNVLVDTAGALYAGAVVLKAFFPELDLWYTCLGLAFVAGLYTAAGGLAAVVYTDVIQAVVLLLGSVLLTIMVLAHPAIDFSLAAITQGIPSDLFSIMRPLDDPNLPWLGTLVGVPLLGFYFWCTNQFIVQRLLGAKTVDDARYGALLGGLLKLPVLFIMVLPGLLATLIFPDLSDGDQVFPTLVTQLLPTGVVGLVMAGLIAAIMSSIDSTLNSASTLITLDFVKPRRPDMSPTQVAWVGRVAMGVIMVLSAAWAPQIANFEGLFRYLQEMLAYIVPPVTVLFLFGSFTKKGTGTGALLTLLIGHVVSIGVFVGQKAGWLPDLHFTLVAAILFAVSALIFFAADQIGERRPLAEIQTLLVGDNPPPQPGLRDYRIWSVLLLVMTLALVIAFW